MSEVVLECHACLLTYAARQMMALSPIVTYEASVLLLRMKNQQNGDEVLVRLRRASEEAETQLGDRRAGWSGVRGRHPC